MLVEATVADQECHVGIQYLCVLDAAGDGWNICTVVWQIVNYFEASFIRPSKDNDAAAPRNAGCCTMEIAVPWNDCFGVVELGLWLMLSTVAVVKTPPVILGGQTTCSW